MQFPQNGNLPQKTPKQLEKEAKKLAKLEKFKQKQDTIHQKVEQSKGKSEVGPGRIVLQFCIIN